MTIIHMRGHGRLRRLIGRWLGRGRPERPDLDLIELEGLDGHLMRDIGLLPARDRIISRDVFR